MSNTNVSIAVVCSSNMNRSMEAHALLRKKGFNIRSFGTDDKIKLPGTALDKPNIYDFGCSYDEIYRDLYNKDKTFYTQNGLLNMLDRNRRIKSHPERFQMCRDEFTVIITCEKRVYGQVFKHFNSIQHFGNNSVHVFNIDTEDTPQDATIGAFLICELVTLISRCKDLDRNIDKIAAKFGEKSRRLLAYCSLFN